MQSMTESKINIILINKSHTDTTKPKDTEHYWSPGFNMTLFPTQNYH